MATTTSLAPIPYKTPLLDSNGLLTPIWQNWMRQIFNRTGGNVASVLFNPMAGIGDLIYGGAAGTPTALPADITNTRKFLRQLSVLGIATPPVWDTLLAADIPTLNYISSVTAQAANTFLAGPSSGAAVAPSFRLLTASDIPAMNGMVSPLTLASNLTLQSGYCTTWPDLTIPNTLTLTVVSGSVLQGVHSITIASGGKLQVNSGGIVNVS